MYHPSDSRRGFSSAATLATTALVFLVGGLAILGFRSAPLLSHQGNRDESADSHTTVPACCANGDDAQHEQPADDWDCEADPPFDVAGWVRVITETSLSFPSNEVTSERVATRFERSSEDESHNGKKDYWAFRRLQVVSPPPVLNEDWIRNPIDRFILAQLEQHGVKPTQEASRRVLGRRLWFDLIGLPPEPAQIASFADDHREEAYDRLVDRLLADRGFGERWGRTWLDLARYADSNGYEEDELRPFAFTYRDFVIAATNADLGFDRFVKWQIAGDEIAPNNPLAVAATGFLTAPPLNTFLPQESERRDELDDIVSTIGVSMLGLTIGCARCHDHRYDPISTSDYYRMIAIFEKTQRTHSFLAADGGAAYEQQAAPLEKRRRRIKEMRVKCIVEDRLADLDFSEAEKDVIRRPLDSNNQQQLRLLSQCMRCLMIDPSDLIGDFEPLPADREEYEQLRNEIFQIARTLPPAPPKGLTISGSEISTTHVLDGGDLKRPRRQVGPGFVSVLTKKTKGRPKSSDDAWKTWAAGGGTPRPRTALANWITDTERGAGALVARVIVNRLWQHHFGHGLVRTPNDFGSHGDRPTHPELLEWLACELVDNHWSLKTIHRLIVTSATYRQGVATSPRLLAADPTNARFGRRQPLRLTAEMYRDALLQVGGTLNRNMYGPAVIPPIPKEAIFQTQKSKQETWPAESADSPNVARRAIYMLTKRTIPIPLLQLFDGPEGSFPCGKRKTTTVPTQALAILNSPFVRDQAAKLADRADSTEGASSDEGWLRQVYLCALARLPRSDEENLALAFLQGESQMPAESDQRQRRVDFCHALLMSNEFLYID